MGNAPSLATMGSTKADKRPRWRRCPELVEVILARAHEPWVPITLNGAEVGSLRPGGMVIVLGPPGGGKTALVSNAMIEHARDRGPVVILSRELPADELIARAIAIRTGASWTDVLRGRVSLADMQRAADLPRLIVLDRKDATLGALDSAIGEIAAEYPGEPILAVVDYVQILEATERDVRARVAEILARIDDIARARRVAVMAVSQMSRAAARTARAGDALGAESADGGAESAAIERFATLTLSIGAAGPEREDGARRVDLSTGKGRMGGGDRVYPVDFYGASGRMVIAGEARSGAEVKAERAEKRGNARAEAAELAIPTLLEKSSEPMTRGAVRERLGMKNDDVGVAVRRLLAADDGRVVEVRGKKSGGYWPLWTASRAAAAGLDVVPVLAAGGRA